MGASDSYLTIRFAGPEVKASRMRLDDFVQASRRFSLLAQSLALALQHLPSVAKGRRPEEILQSLSLDLVGFSEGSPVAVVHLERAQTQALFEELDWGDKTYSLLLRGVAEASATEEGPLPEGFDLGVLMKLRDFGKLFSKGVDSVEFCLNHRSAPVRACFDRNGYQRVRSRINRPECQRTTVEGRLLMADFKEGHREIRIHPSASAPLICRFPQELAEQVKEQILGFVRVTGKMAFYDDGRPRWIDLTDIEPLEAAESHATAISPGWGYDFWEDLSAEEYAARQGVKAVESAQSLYGSGNAEDWEGFEDALERWRDA